MKLGNNEKENKSAKCEWKKIIKIRQRRAKKRETKDLQILQEIHKSATKGLMFKTKGVEPNPKSMSNALKVLTQYNPWPRYKPNKAHVDQRMTNLLLSWDSRMKPAHACDCWKKN